MTLKMRVAILGATGAVGQQLILRLADHPLFEIAQLSASESSEGLRFKEAAGWMLAQPLPDQIGEMIISSCAPQKSIPWTFSALSEKSARAWEIAHRDHGKIVFSASSAHRMLHDVPLIAAQVNIEHLSLIQEQRARHRGAIIAKPNCVVTGLALTLKALNERFGLEKVMCHALQSVSGGGFRGVAALEILDNLLPLPDEESKIEKETAKVLGAMQKGRVEPAQLAISARCLRVAITEGHLLAVEIATRKKVFKEQIVQAWSDWNETNKTCLNSQPEKSIEFIDHSLYPQPRFNRYAGRGMTTVVGSLRACGVLQWKYLSLTHNIIQGAAGGLVLIAEALREKELDCTL